MLAVLASIVLALQALTSTATLFPATLRKRDIVRPVVVKAELLGNVTDPMVSRDSCNSVKIKSRTLWTCRDTNAWDPRTDQSILPLVVNSAAWTDFKNDGLPDIITNGPIGAGSNGKNSILQMYGKPTIQQKIPFFPLSQPDACTATPGGGCSNGTRTVVWQDSAPMVTASYTNGLTTAYTFIANWHIDKLVAQVKQPAYSLYKMVYDNTLKDRADVPTNTLVDPSFWDAGDIGYGAYGRLVRNNYAYLYGQGISRGNVSLARVPIRSVEDKSKYQYYVNGAWTSRKPTAMNPDAWIPNAGSGKQGRFWYSEYFDQYMWVGQRNGSHTADFYLTTAPAPEGPWITPYLIYSGKNGDGSLPSYSLQAHPALLKNSNQNGIYLTWTQAFAPTTYGGYVTPLVYLTFR